VPSLLLTTIDRRSCEKRTSSLFYSMVGETYVIVGFKGGADTQPGWYLNLHANPVVEMQVARKHFTARARVSTGKKCEQLWEQIAQLYPPFASTRRRTNARSRWSCLRSSHHRRRAHRTSEVNTPTSRIVDEVQRIKATAWWYLLERRRLANSRLQPDRGPRAVLRGCETRRLGRGG
jgi:deazaflavin-dependent oxidoreductase (nitroreductase family)